MSRSRLVRLLATGGAAIIATCALPGTANAQFSPCALLGPGGAFIPPPCPIIDVKKLADLTTQEAQELEKVQQTIATIQQAKTATQGIVSDVRDLADVKIDLSLPNVDTNFGPLLDGLKGSIQNSITSYAQQVGDKMFAGVDASTEASQQALREREMLAVDGNLEAYAYGVQGVHETEESDKRIMALSQRRTESKDLRSDWAINSAIKIELMNARARQSYLMTALLRLNASGNAVGMTSAVPKSYAAGTAAGRTLASIIPIDQSPKVTELTDLLSKAQGILGSLSVVTMAASAVEAIKQDTLDYQSYVAMMDQKAASMRVYAQTWSQHGDHCAASTIINGIMSGHADQVQHCISTSSHRTDLRDFTSFAYGVATTNNAYPEGDPQHYNYQPGLNYYEAEKEYRTEKLADEQAQLSELQARIDEENAKQGGAIDAASATNDLQAIVDKANALGADISSGQDEGSKQRAADLLNQMNALLSGGTALPSGNVDAGGNTYPVPVSDGSGTVSPVPQSDPQSDGTGSTQPWQLNGGVQQQ